MAQAPLSGLHGDAARCIAVTHLQDKAVDNIYFKKIKKEGGLMTPLEHNAL